MTMINSDFKSVIPNADLTLKESLLEKKHHYRQILQSLPAATYICDSLGRITFFNEAAAKLWGREPELGVDLWCGSWKIYKTDGTPLPLDTCPMGIALKEGRAVHGEEIIIERPNGERLNVLPHPRPIFDNNGVVVEAVNMLVDITDLKRIDQALKESELRFRTAADSAPVLIWMSGTDKHFIFFNKSWTTFTGRTTQQEAGFGWAESLHPEDLEKLFHNYTSSFNTRKNFYSEFRLKRHDGEYRWVVSRGEPRYTPDGKFEGYIGSCSDIHDTKLNSILLEQRVAERTKALNEAVLNLERSNLELAQFAYVATHDLQEPLRKIKTFTDRLQLKTIGKLTEDERSYLDKIKNSTSRMSGLVRDVLNYSTLSRSAEPFAKTDLNEILKNVITDFELAITQKKAKVIFDSLPVIDAIPLQMNQLFNNLISNALKFINKDIVPELIVKSTILKTSEIEEYKLSKDNAYIKLSFYDNGIGFEEQYAERIFEIFQRLNGRDEYPGTGIGLALCKKIIDHHNGLIYANSVKGNGTFFTVILPVKQIK